MKHFIGKVWKNRFIRWTGIIIIVGVAGFAVFGGSATTTYEVMTVGRADVVETVSATGQIKPKSSASLRFRVSGTIAKLLTDVGAKVRAGDLLATLDDSDLSKKVTQAEADYNSAVIKYANARQNTLDTSAKNEEAIQLLYADAPNTFSDILNLAQQEYSTFVAFYDVGGHIISTIAGAVPNAQLINNADNAKIAGDAGMALLNARLRSFSSTSSRETVDETLIAIHQPLQQLQTSLIAVIEAVAGVPTGAINATTLDTYRTSLATAKTNLTTAIGKEVDLGKNIRNTKVTNTVNLNTAQADERNAEANVESARASLDIARRNLSDAYLRAPIDGVVAVKDVEIGELVTTADQVFYLLGNQELEVVSNIPEVDVARLKVGGEVDATLDALSGDEHFPAVIVSIDPDQTTVDGVVYYKTHFKFNQIDPRFKPGMSVNLTIVVNRKSNVVAVPRRAVSQKNGSGPTARVLPEGMSVPVVRELTIGLKGDNLYEVLSGLMAGERVVVSEKVAQ